MDWIIWLLIGLFVLVFVSVSILALEDGPKEYFKYFHWVIVITILMFILSPFILIASFGITFKYITDGRSNDDKITKFTIPKIDEEISIVLKNLGFERVNKYNSYKLNRSFDGFYKYKFEITMDGKGMFFGEPSRKEKYIIDTLKGLKSLDAKLSSLESYKQMHKQHIEREKEELKKTEEKIKELKQKDDLSSKL